MRLIDADALMELLNAWKDEAQKRGADINNMFASAMIAQVNAMPTIEPERKKGKWIRFSADGFHCKECGATFCVIQGEDKMNFCPNCRTEMSGGDAE